MKSKIDSCKKRAFTVPELVVVTCFIGLITLTVLLLRIQCSGPDLQYMPASGKVPELTSFALYPWMRSYHSHEAVRLKNARIHPALITTNAPLLPMPLQAE